MPPVLEGQLEGHSGVSDLLLQQSIMLHRAFVMLLLTLTPRAPHFPVLKVKLKQLLSSCKVACCLCLGPTCSTPSPGLPLIPVQRCWEQPPSLLQGEGARDGGSWATTQPPTPAAAMGTQPWQPFQMANLVPAVCGARLEDRCQSNEGK